MGYFYCPTVAGGCQLKDVAALSDCGLARLGSLVEKATPQGCVSSTYKFAHRRDESCFAWHNYRKWGTPRL
jgi:hypothetical protein